MKIAWFTPFNYKSAIGLHYSKPICEKLSKNHLIDIWSIKEKNLISTKVPIIHYSSKDKDIINKINRYDLIIYNLGNHYPYHKEIFEVMKKQPGIVILHDYVMHHFYSSYCFLEEGKEKYYSELKRYYSKETFNLLKKMELKKIIPWENENFIIKAPFFEPFIFNSYGIIIHSNFFLKKILPYRQDAVNLFLPIELPNDNKKSNKYSKYLIITTIGHINKNKNIDLVIDLIYKIKSKIKINNIIYQIIGETNDKNYLKKILKKIKKYNLEKNILITGYVDLDKKIKYLKNTDIFINLRNPVMEGASYSLLEEMSYGKPVVVYNLAHYKEIPDNCVYKTQKGKEENALLELIKNKKLREEIGKNGKECIKNYYNLDLYCKKFIDYCNKVISNLPKYKFIDNISYELNSLIEFEENSINRLSKKISEIINKN